MLLSIVIPAYNMKDYLEGCLQSILACDTADCEILIVDDGSTDGVTPALCDRLASRYSPLVRVIHQENKGLGGARNTGLEAASGEYVFFPDSDDKVTSDALTVIKKYLQEKPDILAFDFCSDDGEGHLTPMTASQFHSETPFRLANRPDFLLSLPSAWARVWKRSLFLEGNIRYPSQVWYEDIRTSMKLFALADSIIAIPDALYLYLQRPGSIMHSAKIQRNHEIIDAFQDLLGWFRKKGLWETYKNELCRLCIDHVYLAASVRVLSADPGHPLLREFREYLQTNFPDYKHNPYLPSLTKSRQLVFRLLEMRLYRVLRLLFRVHPSH